MLPDNFFGRQTDKMKNKKKITQFSFSAEK